MCAQADSSSSGSAPEHRNSNTKVFVCWSGTRSLALAKRFSAFLVESIPELKNEVFVSTQLDKGIRWFEEIVRRLEGARAGVLCLTAENLASPWLHFEAGALAKGLHDSPDSGAVDSRQRLRNRIFTYLHGVTGASLAGPLAQYQSTATTREDTYSLIKALVAVLFPAGSGEQWSSRFNTAWPAFEHDLKRIVVPVQELLPEFERWFRRKTFDEALQQCTDQNWPARYDGARQTHDRLSDHIGAVRNACPRYQVDLYERLLETVDAYAMDIRALLLKAPAFKLGESGEVVVEPQGILRACENRRRNVKEILSRLLDPLAVPVAEEAAVFWLTDSFDQRKMLVHRREHSVLELRDRIHQPARKRQPDNAGPSVSKARDANAPHLKPLDHLPPNTRKMFNSIWDLDRILGYIMTEYLYPDAGGAADSVRQAAVMELERFRARGEGASLMPLHYALGALKAALCQTHHAAGSSLEAPAVAHLLSEIEQLIEASRPQDGAEPTLDKGRQVRRTIGEVRTVLQSFRPASASTRPARRTRRQKRQS